VTKRKSLIALLGLACIVAMVGLRCGEDRGTEPELPEYGINPDYADIEVSSVQQFTVAFDTTPAELVWYVDGVRGGSPESGMITPEGLFIAPPEVPPGGSVTITAEAVLDTAVRETATAVITSGYGTPFVSVTPGSASVAVADSAVLSVAASGCPFAEPAWSAIPISPTAGDAGDMKPGGTYVAPAAVADDLILMVRVESSDCPGKQGIAKVVIKKPVRFVVQLEDFTDSYGSGITKTTPCSGGYAVSGMEVPGEWIEVPFEIPAGGTFVAEIHYAAQVNDVLEAALTIYGCPNPPSPGEIDFRMAQGNGLG
jgi:hypothetical protein